MLHGLRLLLTLVALPAIAAPLVMIPDGAYVCPDGTQLLVISCYGESAAASCAVERLDLPLQRGYRVRETLSHGELTTRVQPCGLRPIRMIEGTASVIDAPSPQRSPSAQSAAPSRPAMPPRPHSPRPPTAGEAEAVRLFADAERLFPRYLAALQNYRDLLGRDAPESESSAARAAAKALEEEVGNVLWKVVELNPNAWRAQRYLAQIQIEGLFRGLAETFESGMWLLKEVRQVAPQDVETLRLLCEHVQESREAVEVCNALLALRPAPASATQTMAFERVGELLLDDGSYAPALNAYTQAAKLAPNDAAYWKGIGRSQRGLGNYQEALSALAEARRLAPSDVGVLLALAQTQHSAGKTNAAIDTLRDCISKVPEAYNCHYDLSELYRAANRPTEAQRARADAVSLVLAAGRDALSSGFASFAPSYLETLQEWDPATAAILAAEIRAHEARRQ